MAKWVAKTIREVINDIDDGKYVLPVIQRSFVWTEEKMELLFDTLLKGDSFSGIIAIEEEKGFKPLFSYRGFSKTGDFIDSKGVDDELKQNQYFIIDGQQRLQTFYIGLMGSINGKDLYFDLYSEAPLFYEFKFAKDKSELSSSSREEDKKIKEHFWYPVKSLLKELKQTNTSRDFIDDFIDSHNITDKNKERYIDKNINAFYSNVLTNESLGISIVHINKRLPELENRQRIVELFRRLNDGGTRLSSFDLVASILKGFDWKMESFLKEILQEYKDIGLTQDNLIKLIFLLQDDHKKEMSDIQASDADFAIKNQEKIKSTLSATRDFLKKANLYEYYKDRDRSFIPIFFIAYHLFHKDLSLDELEHYFDNYETGNSDFSLMSKWIFNSLLNGVFRSRGAGWVSYKTGVRKLLNKIRDYKDKDFPCDELFDVYISHPITFTQQYSVENLNNLEPSFVYYLMYDCKIPTRVNDVDHIIPKALLQLDSYDYGWDEINNIANYQLLDYSTNRGNKNASSFYDWIMNDENVKDKEKYLNLHLIPRDSNLWKEDRFRDFLNERAKLIIEKINKNI